MPNEKLGNKILILLVVPFFTLFLFSFVTAQSDDRVVIKQITEHDLKRPCFNDGAFCSSAATCNLTISQPNGAILLDNVQMTNSVSYHNFTMTKTQTVTPGTHKAIMSCTDGTESGEDTFDILISPSGSDDNSLASLLLLGFMFVFSGGAIVVGFNKKDPIFVLFGAMGLTVFGLYTLLNGVGNYRNTMTQWGSVISLGIAGYIGARTSMEMMNG